MLLELSTRGSIRRLRPWWGWSKEDIASLEGLIAFVNTFEGLGASKEDVRGWIGPAKRKRVVVNVLLDMAVSHSYLVKEDEEMYVIHTQEPCQCHGATHRWVSS